MTDGTTQQCEHEAVKVEFDKDAAATVSSGEVRRRWPRFYGPCPTCGETLIKYASSAHYIFGDW